MTKSIFINLLHAQEKEAALTAAVGALSGGEECATVHAVEPVAFGAIPGAPFAYWASDRLRSLFTTLRPFEGTGRTAKQGLATADDFRFVRAWWEVPADRVVGGTADTKPEEFRAQTFAGKRWVPFAKGGAYSPYYADLHLVVDWERDGAAIRGFKDPLTGRPYSRAQATEYYFRPGLTWPRRTTSGISVRTLPAGAIFADKGPAAFGPHPFYLLGLMQSRPFSALISLSLGAADAAARSYEVGIMQRIPMPAADADARLESLAADAIQLKHALATAHEVSHTFTRPALLQGDGPRLADRVISWQGQVSRTTERLKQLQAEADEVSLALYRVDLTDCNTTEGAGASDAVGDSDGSDEADAEGGATAFSSVQAAADVVSYLIGLAFGRWQLQAMTPATFDPLAPLPVHSPGMRQAAHDASQAASDAFAVDGILVEDEGHPRDLAPQVVEQLAHLFPDPFAIEQELCQLLGARTLRGYLTQKLFADHIRRYSMSRRKAPIYWRLCSPEKHYALWLYYPSLTRDTLYVALRDYVGPKLAHEEEILQVVKAQVAEARLAGVGVEQIARQFEAQEAIVRDVSAFRDELKAIADAGYDPDLNDGVLINIAPLHRLVPWKDAAACYKELKAGKYPWSSMYQRYTFR